MLVNRGKGKKYKWVSESVSNSNSRREILWEKEEIQKGSKGNVSKGRKIRIKKKILTEKKVEGKC